MSEVCPHCGNEYQKIGTHWRYSPDHRQSLSEKQREIITGIMMGDGSLDRNGKNPLLAIEMVNKEYLDYIDGVFGVLSTGVSLKNTAEEVCERSQHSGFTASNNPDNYSDKYRVRTRSLPELKEWNWYTDNGKIWPEDIELTPTVLKHWYAGDGSLNNNGHRFYVEIHLRNERENKEKVEKYFEDIGICIDRWRDDGENGGNPRTSIIFNKEKSRSLLGYMGDPLPGFEYKWGKA